MVTVFQRVGFSGRRPEQGTLQTVCPGRLLWSEWVDHPTGRTVPDPWHTQTHAHTHKLAHQCLSGYRNYKCNPKFKEMQVTFLNVSILLTKRHEGLVISVYAAVCKNFFWWTHISLISICSYLLLTMWLVSAFKCCYCLVWEHKYYFVHWKGLMLERRAWKQKKRTAAIWRQIFRLYYYYILATWATVII